jgi:hypothetical protein
MRLRKLMFLLWTFSLLLASKIGLRWFPVRWLLSWKQRHITRSAVLPELDERAVRDSVRWAVLTVAAHSPLEFVCFPQCLAACVLLRRQGIDSQLHYGIARKEGKLMTHTWLESGGVIVIGGEVSEAFTELAVY